MELEGQQRALYESIRVSMHKRIRKLMAKQGMARSHIQFTEVLGLVEMELKALQVPYTKLTGQTRKRQQAIDSCQNGEVPVFLISLKAGGSGLNLTAEALLALLGPLSG